MFVEPTAEPPVIGSKRAVWRKTVGATIMSTAEIAKLEDAGRATMAYAPEVYEGESNLGFMLRAVTPGD